ncbi:MAG TPA: Rieske 2Fe-2S domain-containing protein [Acidimicrobiales bacterium]
MADQTVTTEDLWEALEYFWHPVASQGEVRSAGGVLPVRLLSRDLVVAELGPGSVAAMVDRCPHRSTRLSLGCVERGALRCGYHGWRWGSDGRCVEVPSAPGKPIPERFRVDSFEAVAEHGLVWVRLQAGVPTRVPPAPAEDDPAMRVVAGVPYTWPTGAARRVENFVDLAHFAWVHDGTLGDRSHPVPPEVDLARQGGELRFDFVSPDIDDQQPTALLGPSRYRMPMPLTVNIEFEIAGSPGARRHLWMTASPLDPGVCRTFWSVARNDSLDQPDEDFLEFQHKVLAEDEPVVCNQVPAEIPLDAAAELHAKADRVSLEYRRWLREIAEAGRRGRDALAQALGPREPMEAPCAI